MKAVTSISFDAEVLITAKQKHGRALSSHINDLLRTELELKDEIITNLGNLDNELTFLKAKIWALEQKRIDILKKSQDEQKRVDEANEEGKRRALRVQ